MRLRPEEIYENMCRNVSYDTFYGTGPLQKEDVVKIMEYFAKQELEYALKHINEEIKSKFIL